MRPAMRTVVRRTLSSPAVRSAARPLRHGLVSVSVAGALVFAAAAAADAASAPGTPSAAAPCPRGYDRIVCVDLDHQTLWMQDADGTVTFGPVPIRSGRKGFATRTGMKRIYLKKVNEWSSAYNVSMPYTEYFDRGQALHSYAGPITAPPGSHGCVNMRNEDAKRLFSLTRVGDHVYIWGRRP
jgi:hypothetical protein